MGSWNESCFLTGMSLSPGEKVRWMVITKAPYRTSKGCYTTAFWFPRALPLRGEYDDYGNAKIYDKDSIFAKQLLESFQTDLVEKEGDEYRHSEITKANVSLESLMDWFHEEKVEVVDSKYCTEPRILATTSIMISERAWQGLMGMTLKHDWKKSTYSLANFKKDAHTFANKADKIAKKLRKENKFNPGSIIRDEDRMYGQYYFKMELKKALRPEKATANHNAFLWFGIISGGGEGWPPGAVTPLNTFGELVLSFYREELTKKELLDWMLEAAEFMWFDRAMSGLRKVYGPTGMSGSQSEENEFVRNYHEMMTGVFDKLLRERKLEREEDDRSFKRWQAAERRKKVKADLAKAEKEKAEKCPKTTKKKTATKAK